MVLVLPKRGATERPRVAFEAAEQEASSGAPTEVVAQTTTVWRFRTVSVSRASNQRRSCSAGQPGCSHPRLPRTRASAPPTDPLKKSAGIEAAVAEAGERLGARWQLEQAARERLREVHWPPRPGAPSGRDALPTAGVRAHQLSEADYGRVGPPRRCDCFPHSVLRDRNARHGRDGEGPRLACDGPEVGPRLLFTRVIALRSFEMGRQLPRFRWLTRLMSIPSWDPQVAFFLYRGFHARGDR
jgi:hypothetical protein